ncbi:AraC family transcriptional regulator [Lentzea flaviverrucosa]|uniref:AraC-type DNA-binding protein n=1 Tax=Lentzea flaviverrucosa TaxID=200379 RepID=A0A1H9WEP0_9PSEU|nr:AraC family transcriptional regulator [Lentzea flaviverrucosa]RDI22149.1 AraC-like DNA-binding protein [Lentzea flaviverrucosa]SES32406.1 AraC-type DNA-binding protein [Lentzea flaviverrucosa]
MNPLEQVLSALSVNWVVATPLHAGGRWALHFVERLDLRVEVVVHGRAHVTVAGESFWAEQDDRYVIAGRRPYRIAADPDTPSVFAAPYYEDLRHPWTVRERAAVAAVSRSAFFARFGESTGMTPLGYLYRLRMRHAARLLRDTGGTVASVAAATGHRTESAFCAAFRRFAGRSPGEYRTGIVT